MCKAASFPLVVVFTQYIKQFFEPPAPIMDEILNQLGGLALGAVPTMVLFLLLVVAYGLLVRRPLDRVLAERRARTTGAVERARGEIAKAEARTADCEDRLRRARKKLSRREQPRGNASLRGPR